MAKEHESFIPFNTVSKWVTVSAVGLFFSFVIGSPWWMSLIAAIASFGFLTLGIATVDQHVVGMSIGLFLSLGLGFPWLACLPITGLCLALIYYRTNPAVHTIVASLLCIVAGLLIGYIVLLIINPSGAWDALTSILKNFLNYNKQDTQMKYLGQTLVKTAPLIMCSLSVLFAYKVGLFNIGVAGQYVLGAGASVYFAVAFGWGWLPCLLMALAFGAISGAISGALKAYRNVNEVISGIMLNWISLYGINTLLSEVKEPSSNYTYKISQQIINTDGKVSTVKNTVSKLPSLGLEDWFNKDKYVGLAIPLAILLAVLVWVLLTKTKKGYELRATGLNKNAAKYCGMRDKSNIILTMAIAGGLASIGAAMFYLTDFEQWSVTQASVPSMGFNGIAAAFLGGLHPIGAIFSSLFIQQITDGGAHLNLKVYPKEISTFISSLIIYFCGFVMFFRQMMIGWLKKKDEAKGGTVK